ncbi:MAG: TerB family tellurite resistance protein [Bacteroidales bacterium]
MFKFLGLIIGGITGGFWGAVAGFFIGGLIDSIRRIKFTAHLGGHYSQDQFIKILLILTAAVMKADNKMVRSELDYVKNYLWRNLGPTRAQQALSDLKEIMNQEYNIQSVCYEIQKKGTIQERLLILQFLFGLASADGNFDQAELNMIQQIAGWMGISQMDFEALKSMYMGNWYQQGGYTSSNSSSYSSYAVENLEYDYKILEISAEVSDDEVKKAYRKAAMKHHPDKVNHLGEEMRKAAEEKFAKLNQAYDRIKKSRGMN